MAGSHYSPRDHSRAERSASRRSQSEIQVSSDAERPGEHSQAGACEQPNSDRHPCGLPPTARARISPVRHSNPDPVYLRAAAGTSPVVAFPPPVVSEVEPLAATPRGAMATQWINALQRTNPPTFSKLFQSPRPSQAGQARSASRSAVTISDLDPASDPGRRASLEGHPPKPPSDFRRRSLALPEAGPCPRKRKVGLIPRSRSSRFLGARRGPRALGGCRPSWAVQKPRPTTRPQRRGNPDFSPARPLAPVRSLVTGGARSTTLAALGKGGWGDFDAEMVPGRQDGAMAPNVTPVLERLGRHDAIFHS